MKKILITICSIGIFLIPQITFSFTNIYNEEIGIVYLGGSYISSIAYMIDKKLESDLRQIIYEINLKEGKEKTFVNTQNSIKAYEKSTNNYIAISTMRDDLNEREFRGYLSIYNMSGNKIKVIENVIAMNEKKFFSWSPNGTKIVYITGKSIVEDRIPFRSSGVWIYDVEENETVKISEGGASINWFMHDNNIYIGKTYDNAPPIIDVYNTSTGKLEKSDKKGMIFSDDGQYYIGYERAEGYDYSAMYLTYIFDNDSNKKRKFTEEEEFIWRNAIMLDHKFINNTHYLLTWNSKGYRIINVDKVKVIRKVDKQGIIGWNKDMTKIVVYEGGDKIHIDELLTGKRLKSLDIPK